MVYLHTRKACFYQSESKNILFYVLHMSANSTHVMCNFMNIDDGSKVTLYYHQLSPNDQISIIKKIVFPIFYKFKCQST